MKKIIILTFSCFLIFSLKAQIWEDNLRKEIKAPTHQERFQAFEEYRQKNPYFKGNGYNPYAREMDFINSRVVEYENFNPNSLYVEWVKEKNKHGSPSMSNWTEMGPINTPIINATEKPDRD